MTLAERLRVRTEVGRAAATPRSRSDVLFLVVVGVLIAVHATIFIATMIAAPVTPMEQRGADLLHVPVEAARALVLPFHALLLVSLFVIGRRVAGRWAGFGSMLALLALNLRADPALPVYGPPTAGGAWIAAALLAAALAVLPQRRLLAAALLGAAVAGDGMVVLALPPFLAGLALSRTVRPRAIAAFAGVWAAVAAAAQVLWLGSLGVDGWLARLSAFTAEFRPHPLTPFLEQQQIVFSAWHFPWLLTVALFLFLLVVAGIGFTRYLAVPRPGERGTAVARVLARVPAELWAAVLTLGTFGSWWAFSGSTAMVAPNLPALAAIAPLLTAFAYRGAKWLLTVNAFWRLAATVYLTGLVTARSLQLILTLVQAFQR